MKTGFPNRIPRTDGFTLIEIIITMMVAAILGTIMYNFMGTNMTRSAETLVAVQNGVQIQDVMEKITRDYREWLASRKTSDSLLSTGIILNDYNDAGKIQVDFNDATNEASDDFFVDGDIEVLEVRVKDVRGASGSANRSLVAVFTNVIE